MPTEPRLETDIRALDAVLEAHRAVLGADYTAYRNHTHRIVNLCAALSSADAQDLEKIAVAAAFHDLGIWTDRTFDYLPPSVKLASAFLNRTGRQSWTPEISAMILAHHKVSPYRGDQGRLVEPFRRADWIDVSKGLLTFGVSRALVTRLYTTWPSEGFHGMLVRLALDRLRTHPLNPLPMVKL